MEGLIPGKDIFLYIKKNQFESGQFTNSRVIGKLLEINPMGVTIRTDYRDFFFPMENIEFIEAGFEIKN